MTVKGRCGAMLTEFGLGDRVKMRKNHACGANEWLITRTGADIRIKCTNCGRDVLLDRLDFMRAATKRTFVNPDRCDTFIRTDDETDENNDRDR